MNLDQNLSQLKESYIQKGTLVVSLKDKCYPIEKNDLEELNSCCKKVEKEYISIGDAGEPNNLLVGRFMTDVEIPKIVNNLYSKKLIDILWSENVKSYIKFITNVKEEIFIRRVRYQLFAQGGKNLSEEQLWNPLLMDVLLSQVTEADLGRLLILTWF